MKSIILLIFLFIFPVVSVANSVQDRVVMVNNQDPDMRQAITKARSTLDEFLRLKRNPPKGATEFKLKVLILDKSHAEHMWVMSFKQTAKGFSGTLNNEPEFVRNVHNGQQIKFLRKDISDWAYLQNGKPKGNFTTCVLLQRMPPTEAQKYRAAYGFEC